jgi:hypothetical protein
MADQILESTTIEEATDEEAFEALDYTSRYFLNMGAAEFLQKLDAGEIRPDDDIPGLRGVLAMVSFYRG